MGRNHQADGSDDAQSERARTFSPARSSSTGLAPPRCRHVATTADSPGPRSHSKISAGIGTAGGWNDECRMTQGALADAAEMSLPYVSEMERGMKVPSLTTLVRLAVALNCRVTALVSDFDNADLRAMIRK